MKHRHNIRPDQPIVNVTYNTFTLFAATRTLAPPVCVAADSSTANSGGVR
ncbi:MAG: hypothetical protein U9N36_05195 [Euryarchaeota archaeon]|nr:hypothetical protein [Euryarchaeota archaeon]